MYRQYLSAFLALGLIATNAAAQVQPQPPSAPVRQIRLAKGTPVPVRMDYGVSAKSARVGDPVYLKVVAPVPQKGVVVIPEGSVVTGRVTTASPPSGGQAGELVIEMESVDTGKGRIPLTGSTGDRGRVRTTSVNEGVLTVPFGAQKGKNANIEAGTVFTAYTDRDY